MIAYLKALFARLLAKAKGEIKTVESVLGTFHKAVTDLETLAEQHAKAILAHEAEIVARVKAKEAALEESIKASQVVLNIRALIGK